MPRTVLVLLLAALAALAAAVPAAAQSTTIVISEYRTRGPNGGNDEFIELRNRSAAPVDIGGYTVNGSLQRERHRLGAGDDPRRRERARGLRVPADQSLGERRALLRSRRGGADLHDRSGRQDTDDPVFGRFQEPRRSSERQQRGSATDPADTVRGQAGGLNTFVRRAAASS